MFITKVILAFKLHILFITCYIPLHILFYILYTRPFSYKHVMYLSMPRHPLSSPFISSRQFHFCFQVHICVCITYVISM